MTTKIIDIAFHEASFPATYTGVGTLIGNPIYSEDGDVEGYFTGTGDAVSIPIGSQAVHIKIVDVTDNIIWEWYRGFPATDTLKTVAAGTRTVDTTSAIVVTTDFAGNSTVLLSAALAASGSLITDEIEG